jgi:hypothetical protein
MKAIITTKSIPESPERHNFPGYNFIGIAYSQAAEMADIKLNSDSNEQDLEIAKVGMDAYQSNNSLLESLRQKEFP